MWRAEDVLAVMLWKMVSGENKFRVAGVCVDRGPEEVCVSSGPDDVASREKMC